MIKKIKKNYSWKIVDDYVYCLREIGILKGQTTADMVNQAIKEFLEKDENNALRVRSLTLQQAYQRLTLED